MLLQNKVLKLGYTKILPFWQPNGRPARIEMHAWPYLLLRQHHLLLQPGHVHVDDNGQLSTAALALSAV